ncbi:hypothetical protein BMR07_14385 [Methylococcaceae bacterium CS1]|uniref:copper resistance protein NlpE N-terminal domain-containing protein n=1 Tax=Bathymodiolus platifrons methanotrophic gill symbiont TaxID=113268 RepID=UPI0011C96B68|nr:copper resistance protein NlpE N-terminal domain-containing protein [Bathymodiolus platifrons methanotrophic gill symbiont]TXK93021.1 hypothetical protein BMR11_17630 [Methylococcaceae bacterium CS5]TXK94331.1 hypothetical protein BMR10_13465 [Methylococcaceae bacterium CS4]TXL03761.1 hypothetical protein BMR07_14385 [Methylococcaceae bacterium CS1]TXL03984.1 hypothetical protein BMR09_13695 [Methylococcaceae bacterium CS3]
MGNFSLKNKQNYLLVTQYAQASTKEFYEKGKYIWDDKSGIVTLTARKDSSIRKLRIKDEGTLIVLTSEGASMKGNQDKYTLLRGDKRNSRDVHITNSEYALTLVERTLVRYVSTEKACLYITETS